MKIKIGSIKTINLVDVVEAAGENCWGGNPIWDEMIEHEYGGQTFGNDMIFRYVLPSINGEELSPVQERIKRICWAAMEDEDTIYFDVCW
jgi:hypothetical protein